ncbi:MAG TPA: ATP-binding cassette domain-containing protein [Bacteroidia bacterium]|jgi:cell division transport system ATP-binding protein|nr:ATP-binding cassette domain-containing protein [Bacteroidia bacterium]
MGTTSVIELNNVSISQSTGVVIANLSLNVTKGEFVYLLGKTGSGKSSVLKCLYAEIGVKSGTATVAGYELSKITSKEIPFLRRKLGIVFQDFQLLTDRSIFENLRFVLMATGWKNEEDIKKQINSVLEKVGLTGKQAKMPFEISGGEQQRVAIARALLNQPEIILADEPTGNLDPDTSAEIMKLLIDISKTGTSVLFATHDMLLYNRFPARTLKCENGVVVEVRN